MEVTFSVNFLVKVIVEFAYIVNNGFINYGIFCRSGVHFTDTILEKDAVSAIYSSFCQISA